MKNEGIYCLSWVFHIRLLFFLDLKEINHSYPKYEGKVYKFSWKTAGKEWNSWGQEWNSWGEEWKSGGEEWKSRGQEWLISFKSKKNNNLIWKTQERQ